MVFLGTLRSAASARGIKAITVEIGNPQLFQNQYVQWSFMGVMRILDYLKMFKSDPPEPSLPPPPNTILCSKGFWLYTKTGGVLEVYPQVNTIVRKGDLIARIKNIFGNIVDEIYAPSSGVVRRAVMVFASHILSCRQLDAARIQLPWLATA